LLTVTPFSVPNVSRTAASDSPERRGEVR